MKVCVIGAGLSGLIAARVLSPHFNVTIIEASTHIGGLWHYSSQTDETIPSSDLFRQMYGCCLYGIPQDLKVNIPGQISKFSDYQEFSYSCNMPHHSELMNYINSYANKYDLQDYVTFNTLVTKISQLENGSKFQVETKSISGELTSQIYDYIVICNGHHSVPKSPNIPGLGSFDGTLLHTHNFRTAESQVFDDKVTLIIGGKFSAWDAFEEIINKTNYSKVIIAVRSASFFDCPDPAFDELIQSGKIEMKRTSVSSFNGKEVTFENGDKAHVDNVILAVGYRYLFPFMPELKTSDHAVPIDWYKGTIWLNNPRVAMIGSLAYAAFLKSEMQARIIAHLWTSDAIDMELLTTGYSYDLENFDGPGYASTVGRSLLDAMKSLGVQYDDIWFEWAQAFYLKTAVELRQNMWKAKARMDQAKLEV